MLLGHPSFSLYLLVFCWTQASPRQVPIGFCHNLSPVVSHFVVSGGAVAGRSICLAGERSATNQRVSTDFFLIFELVLLGWYRYLHIQQFTLPCCWTVIIKYINFSWKFRRYFWVQFWVVFYVFVHITYRNRWSKVCFRWWNCFAGTAAARRQVVILWWLYNTYLELNSNFDTLELISNFYRIVQRLTCGLFQRLKRLVPVLHKWNSLENRN